MIIDALIPARGGSKRLPGKNLVLLGGRPLIAHSIRYALNHHLVRHVYVSTDSSEIREVAAQLGALVIDRPPELATDEATTSAVAHHAVHHASMEYSDAVVTLQPTSPLRLHPWLDKCAEMLEDERFDSVATVSPVSAKTGTINDGVFQPSYTPETRSQDMPQRFRENGALYLSRRGTLEAGSVFGSVIGAVVTEHTFADVDIDTYADLQFAETIIGLIE